MTFLTSLATSKANSSIKRRPGCYMKSTEVHGSDTLGHGAARQ
jgi:hypothetical protein